MAVHEVECPNCGAPIDFGGGTQTTCSFCRSVLSLTDGEAKIASTLNDLLESTPIKRTTSVPPVPAPQPASSITSPGADFSEVEDLLNHGKKLEAIRLYREQTGVGAKEAQYVVEAIARHETPASLAQTRIHSRGSTLPLLGGLSTLLFIGMCAVFVLLASQVMFRVWGPLDESLQIINSDFQVKRVFGQPITPGLFVTGKISGSDTASSARLSVPIYGPKHRGELYVTGSWRKGVWDLSISLTYDEGGKEQTITIARKVK